MNIANTGGTLAPMTSHIAPVDGTAHAALAPDADCGDPTTPAQDDAQFANGRAPRTAKEVRGCGRVERTEVHARGQA